MAGMKGREVTAIAKKKLKEQDKRKKLKGSVEKLAVGHKNPQPGSFGERIDTAYQNRQTFKGLLDSGVSVKDARADFKRRVLNQRRIRDEYKRLKRIKKKESK